MNRTFLSIYKGMLEASTFSVDENGEPIMPYYDKELVTYNISTYLIPRLDRYIKDYELDIKFYDKKGGTLNSEQNRYLTISLNASINYLFHYSKAQNFTIMSREQL